MPRVYEPLVLEIEPPYIGSAVSPTVDITETSDDITVTITDKDGEHAYTVEKTDAAIAAAQDAAAGADASAAAADSAAAAANSAASNATSAAAQASTAAAEAGQAAQAATTAAAEAGQAAQAATTAAESATTAAATAGQSAQDADNAAQSATDAASTATTAASEASTAAESATQAATSANTAASAASSAADAANAAAEYASGFTGAYMPEAVTGGADSLTGDATTEQSSMSWASGRDGMARIQSIKGNTVVQDGSLLSVDIRGVRAVGFNQWDEKWERGIWDASGNKANPNATAIRCKNYIPVTPNTTYFLKSPTSAGSIIIRELDANKSHPVTHTYSPNSVFTTGSVACYIVFCTITANNITTYNLGDICINISDTSLNGTYKPYTGQVREIDTSEWFTGGMKSAGSVADELTESEAITRVGVVDLGALNWSKYNASSGETEHEIWATTSLNKLNAAGTVGVVSMNSNKYMGAGNVSSNAAAWINGNMTCCSLVGNGDRRVYVRDDSLIDKTPAEFKEAMSGVMLYYELATPTTTEIDPPLNLAYKTERGGTERVIVDETASTPQSAPPVLEIAYGYTATELIGAAQGIIANVERGKASTNYAVGSYLVMDGTLYRVTTAIASGEAITSSNTTATTVMAEIIRLTQ